MEPQGALAQALAERSFGGQSFFCNSGAEANEAAIKLARAHGKKQGRFKIVTMEGGFHGRTFAALSATAQPKYHAGFEPMVPGFVYVPYNDLAAAAAALDDETAAILVEPVQGEGGINIPSPDYLAGLRRLVRREGRAPRCSTRFRPAWAGPASGLPTSTTGIVPDVLTCAKALAGGIAAGVMMARPSVAASLVPGMHAATFGGNPIACRAAIAVIETIESDGLLERGSEIGARFQNAPGKAPRRAAELDSRDPGAGRHDRLRLAVRRVEPGRRMPEAQAPDQRDPRPRRPAAAGLDDHRRTDRRRMRDPRGCASLAKLVRLEPDDLDRSFIPMLT